MVTLASAARRDAPDHDALGIAQKGLCPVCGDLVRIVGSAHGGRIVGSCGDAFPAKKFRLGRRPVKHFRDIRLRNNAGMDFPHCRANADLLDLDASRWRTTGDRHNVTCLACLRKLAEW